MIFKNFSFGYVSVVRKYLKQLVCVCVCVCVCRERELMQVHVYEFLV